MTAKDIRWGRGGGRNLPASVVLPGEMLTAVCDGGHRYTVVPASLGEPCSGCGCPLRRPDHIDEAFAGGRWPWPDEGWGARVVVRPCQTKGDST